MDRIRPASKVSFIGRPALIGAAVTALVSGGAILASIDFRTQRVDRAKLSIETVRRGTMEIKVAANGQLLSRRIEHLEARVAGRVAKAEIRPGTLVKAGEVVVELVNPQITASAEEAESAWEGAMAELQAAEAELQTELLTQEAVLTQARFSAEKAQAKTESDEALAREGLISNVELKRSQLDRTQLRTIAGIEASRLQKLRDNVRVQVAVRRSRAAQLARALERARGQVADLSVVAGIDGIVQSIHVEAGQQVQPGGAIGRIARQDQLYAELHVPAREATQVQPGQRAVIDTRNGEVSGIVARVDPGVTDGVVIVDVDLDGPLPRGARPQLQVEGTIYVSELPGALYVGKPVYVKNDAALRVYRLDPAGRYASRVTVRTGKVSLHHVQIVSGLREGDRIITSEIGEWQDQERILLE